MQQPGLRLCNLPSSKRVWLCVAALLFTGILSGRAVAQSKQAKLVFPGERWQIASPAPAQWDQRSLAAAVDFALEQNSSSIVVVHAGRIIAEKHQTLAGDALSFRYRNLRHGTNAAGHAIEDVASVQKSVVSALLGIAQHKRLIRLSDRVSQHLGPGWSQADLSAERKITIRHLASMSSGLNSDLEFVKPAGKKWQYNTAAYSLSFQAICAASKMTPNQLTQEWLTKPLQMQDSKWVERRGSENAANKLGFATTAHDLARFGLLMLANGQWAGTTVLPDEKYIRQSVTSSQRLNPAYGFLWWLNGRDSSIRSGRRVRGPLVPAAPHDLYCALGALGRKLYVVPSLQLVVVRLGSDPGREFDRKFWKLLMEAAPTKQKNP